ncbi:AAA family ATPase [Nocardia asteroides]|uniref:AAA family ATPase n=1 Tax=Nocardia asteroides TaxID=1824 RepID=UPI001E4C3F0F|nr:AAA family ATPase [Nocardia asteroides]UGT65170.1 AAA family ATPase [Nocardia asteroides]
MLTVLAVENYRSLRHLIVPLTPLTAVTGANGSGKSSLYRVLRLLAEFASNGAVAALAREGGLDSTLWAGPGRPADGTPVALRVGFAADDFGYAADLGIPAPADSLFDRDPEIKAEAVWSGPMLRPATVLTERAGPVVRVRTGRRWNTVPHTLRSFDSMLGELSDPSRAPDLLSVRDRVRGWRFYDRLRTDAGAPARAPQIGTRTVRLGHDGADLAAALQTIREIGDAVELDAAVDKAFPGSRVEVAAHAGRFTVRLHQPGLRRPLEAAELSDGTLRYLLVVAALLTPRPPELLVLDEPETSLHPELMSALADLIVTASAHTQVIVVTHAPALLTAFAREERASVLELRKDDGRTYLAGQGLLDEPPWAWPMR